MINPQKVIIFMVVIFNHKNKEVKLLIEISQLRKKKSEYMNIISEYEYTENLVNEIKNFKQISSTCMKTAVQLNEQILSLKK